MKTQSDSGSTASGAGNGSGRRPKGERWEKRFAYIEPLKEFVDLKSTNLQRYDLQAFKLKHSQFDPWNQRSNAAIMYLRSTHKTICDGYTFAPGAPRLIEESGRRLLNRWSPGPALLDRKVEDHEIQPWLDHVEFIISIADERRVVLDWLAHLIQRRQPKVNFAILLGGTQGIGKDLMLEPIVHVLGPGNARATSEIEIKDKYTTWVAERELVIMEEVYGLSDEGTNRLKMYIAAPPYVVPMNDKNVKHYEVPNVARFIAMTNNRSALQLSSDDRRWFVIWSDAEPKDPAYYTAFAKWCVDNAILVGSWLAQRDISGFAAQGRAPMTAAKMEMFGDALGSLDYYVFQAIANETAPFDTDLVSVEDALSRLPVETQKVKPPPNDKSLATALRKAGAVRLSRVSLGKPLGTNAATRTVLWAVRRQEMYANLDQRKLAALFWKQRDETANMNGGFGDSRSSDF